MIVAVQTLVFFRESLFGVFQKLLGPYIESFTLSFRKSNYITDEEDDVEEAFAEYDEEKGVIFFPAVYCQRYAAVMDCLKDERWRGRLQKVVDLGYHDMSFIQYLKELPGVTSILGVDIDNIPLRCSSELLDYNDTVNRNDTPLQIMLFQGNAADPDYRLIGCDAVVAIEMIEHMLPHDLERLVHTIFGFIKPWVVIITTPNGDFNVLFKSLKENGFRRLDHYFEWSREQFHDWCSNIVTRYPQYNVSTKGVGPGPEGTEHLGCCSQLALFVAKDYRKQQDLNINSLAIVADRPSNDSTLISDSMMTQSQSAYDSTKLNCSTQRVKKFSKNTLELIERTKNDSLGHTREVVDEIKQLMKTHNLHKKSLNNDNIIWSNINWGYNAPYWNQYYNMVKVYRYPFKEKSEDEMILDVVSNEIHLILDSRLKLSSKIMIPIDDLMLHVEHITNDVHKVRDILEWNGYVVANDHLVYNRFINEEPGFPRDDDWEDHDYISEVKEALKAKEH